MEIFCYVFMCFLSLIGITTVIKWLCFLIFQNHYISNSVVVLCLDDENYEMTITSAYQMLKWQGFAKNILAFDNGLSEKNKEGAVRLLKDYNFCLCNENTLNNKLKDILNE